MMEAVRTSETSVNIYLTTWQYTQKTLNFFVVSCPREMKKALNKVMENCFIAEKAD
jgi:hypothetical protein